MERAKNIGVACIFLSWICISAGFGLKAIVNYSILIGSMMSMVCLVLSGYFFVKAKSLKEKDV